MRSTDRGVSEVLGYVFVFSLVLSSVALVSTVGLDQLADLRDDEQMNNAERAFDLLGANMDDIAVRGAPSRSTEMQLTDGRIDVSDPIQVSFRGIAGPSSPENFSESYEVWPVSYRGEADDSAVVYAGGAVFRTYPDGGATLRKPSIVAKDDRISVPLVHTRSRSVQARSGGTARIRAEHAQSLLLASDDEGTYHTVFANVTSPRANLWVDLLSGYEGFACTLDESGPTDRAVCRASDPDRVTVTLVQVDLSLTS